MTNVDQTTEARPRVAGVGTTLGDLGVVLVAGVAALVAWALWTGAAGVDLAVRAGDDVELVGAGSVGVTAVAVSMAGALLMRGLQAWLRHGRRWWTVVACTVWLVSMVGPLGAETAAAATALASLHLLVGVVVLLGVREVHRAR